MYYSAWPQVILKPSLLLKLYLENQKWWQDIISGEYQYYYEKMYGKREELSK